MYEQISENELICERTISKIADDIDAQSRVQATLGDTYASVLKSNLCLNKDHKVWKTQKIYKKNHIVTNSIVKINLSNLPNLSHFKEIGENFWKFNRNPSAFPVENFHTRIFMKEPSTPQQVGQYITGDITIIKQSGWPIATTPSKRERVNQQKMFFYGK